MKDSERIVCLLALLLDRHLLHHPQLAMLSSKSMAESSPPRPGHVGQRMQERHDERQHCGVEMSCSLAAVESLNDSIGSHCSAMAHVRVFHPCGRIVARGPRNRRTEDAARRWCAIWIDPLHDLLHVACEPEVLQALLEHFRVDSVGRRRPPPCATLQPSNSRCRITGMQ